MKLLKKQLAYILQKIQSAEKVFLFLDYDGTLTPIVKSPKDACLDKATKKLLSALSKFNKYKIAVISGRMLKDIKSRVGIKGIYYAGNHGLEIDIGKSSLGDIVSPEISQSIKIIKKELLKNLESIKGFLIEDKGIVLALHYRNVADKDVQILKNIFKDVVNPYVLDGVLKLGEGKKVLEIRPDLDWDKGKCCFYILKQLNLCSNKVLIIYIGDDLTDEDAFRVLQSRGITIFVKGEKKSSSAEYYVNSVEEVVVFLENIKHLR
ncbi:MAG: trehalose-phosphatase [Candidatus Omnitrophota bacterium]